jgi:hypothetical protein
VLAGGRGVTLPSGRGKPHRWWNTGLRSTQAA